MILAILLSLVGSDMVVTGYTVVDSPVHVRTITVESGGYLDVKDGAEIVFEDSPIPADDLEQLGHGLLVKSGGKLRVTGQPVAPYARVTSDLLSGASFVPLDVPSGWRAGQTLYVPDTRQPSDSTTPTAKPLQHEFKTIRQVMRDGILLDSPLQYSHLGARDADGRPVRFAVIANLSRSITFRSENPNGVRAHCWFNGSADVDIQNAAFLDMGRTTGAPLDSTKMDATGRPIKLGTNQVGRYPLHWHHCHMPFNCGGNVVWSKQPTGRWGITVHQSHWGVVQNNVVVTCAGGGIVTEDGNEYGNQFIGNYVANVTGSGRPDARPTEVAFEGSAYWFRGPCNTVHGNHAYSAQDGYVYYARFANKTLKYPSSPGAMPETVIDPTTRNIPKFTDNECCSCLVGFSAWWIGAQDRTPVDSVQPTVIDNLTAWHVRACVSNYEVGKFTFRNMTAIGDRKLSTDSNGGWGASDYLQWRVVIDGGRIENYNSGIRTPSITDRLDAAGTNPGLFVVRGTKIRCRTCINVQMPWHNATAARLPPITVHLENVNLQQLTPDSTYIRTGLVGSEFTHYGQWVCVGLSHGPIRMRYFSKGQLPTAWMQPMAMDGRIQGAPVRSLNADAWRIYGMTTSGEIASGSTSPGFDCTYTFTRNEPQIAPIPDIECEPGENLSYSVRSYDPSLGELDYSIRGPVGMAIENRSGRINWQARDGVYPVVVTARDVDSGVSVSRGFTVNCRMPSG